MIPKSVAMAASTSSACSVKTVGGEMAAASKIAMKMAFAFRGVNRLGKVKSKLSFSNISVRVTRSARSSNRRMFFDP